METPHAFGFPNVNTPPCPQNSIIMNPSSPSEIRKAVRGIGMDIFWNRPLLLQQLHWATTGPVVSTLRVSSAVV